MQLASVLLARAVAWVESHDLNPRGKVYYPAITEALVKRYGFAKFPQKPEDYDESKGVAFVYGKDGDSVIEQVLIYTNGVVLETRSSTEDSKRLLERALEWAASEIGLAYTPGMIRRWQYYSQLVFTSPLNLTAAAPAFSNLSESINKTLKTLMGEDLRYEATAVHFNFDLLTRKNPIGSFSIQRRENMPFSDNKYFSEAPLPTGVHIELLEQFEKDLSLR
ncbi:MAG: hypothetical protein ABR920_18470 [Terriglobales bacterium]